MRIHACIDPATLRKQFVGRSTGRPFNYPTRVGRGLGFCGARVGIIKRVTGKKNKNAAHGLLELFLGIHAYVQHSSSSTRAPMRIHCCDITRTGRTHNKTTSNWFGAVRLLTYDRLVRHRRQANKTHDEVPSFFHLLCQCSVSTSSPAVCLTYHLAWESRCLNIYAALLVLSIRERTRDFKSAQRRYDYPIPGPLVRGSPLAFPQFDPETPFHPGLKTTAKGSSLPLKKKRESVILLFFSRIYQNLSGNSLLLPPSPRYHEST